MCIKKKNNISNCSFGQEVWLQIMTQNYKYKSWLFMPFMDFMNRR